MTELEYSIVPLVAGDREPMNFELLVDDEAMDLSASTVALQLFEESGAVFQYAGSVSIVDAESGLVRFSPAVGDLRAGASRRILSARWKVTTGSEIRSFPNGPRPDLWIISRPTPAAVAVAKPAMDPVTGYLRIYAGDDYDPDDAYRSIEWANDSWPDLTGASLTLTVRLTETDVEAFTLTSGGGELGVSEAGQAIQRVRVLLLPKAKTVLLTAYGRNYKADVSAVLANGDVVAVVDVDLIAAEKQTRA